MNNTSNQPPSAWLYGAGILILVGGIAATLTFARARFVRTVEAMDRFTMPGDQVVDLEVDGYMLFWEPKSVIDGQPWNEPKPPAGLTCTVVPLAAIAADGTVDRFDVIEPQRVKATQPYQVDRYSGNSFLQFDAVQAGKHRLSCHYPAGDGPTIAVAFDDTGKSGWTHLYVVGSATLSLLLGLACLIFVYVRRARHLGRAGAPPQAPR